MIEFIPRPYKLFNKIQNYDWGTKDSRAFIPKFLGTAAEPDLPYAELWIGAHPKAPSEVMLEDRRAPLNEVVEQHKRECLGDYVAGKFSGKLPFLLKVLSAAKALSIQLHPNKAQAVALHHAHPENYPDDNHKPEIAIALDSLDAIVGFKPSAKIAETLRSLPELSEFADQRLVETAISAKTDSDREVAIRNLYGDIMRRAGDAGSLSACIVSIHNRLSMKRILSHEERLFLSQHELYGTDVGLLSFFFFNMVNLKPGQAIFTDAGVPHAYIEGNIIECMANSDNVVRAGLTNKFKDIDTLLAIVRYEFGECPVINQAQEVGEVVYNTGAEEFRITRYAKGAGFKRVCQSRNRPSVCLIADGEIEMMWSQGGKDHLQSFSKGESFFIPAFLTEFRISSSDGVDFYKVDVP